MSTHSRITLNSPDETADLARQIAATLHKGDVILLSGGIGAGKTHFARALIQSLLIQHEDVPSPTFTLVQTYDTPDFELWHADLYRLTSPDEIEELGLIDAFETAVCIVEWPDRLDDLALPDALSLSFEPDADADGRTLTARWCSPEWTTRLQGLLI